MKDLLFKMKKNAQKNIILEGKSLMFLNQTNCLRKICARVVTFSYFENFQILLIVISTIILALDNPLDDPNSKFQFVITTCNNVLTGLFSFEAVVKIITWGFLFNGRKSYLRIGWNIIDFSVVSLSLISFIPMYTTFKFYKILRLMRLLRPLRFIQKNPGLKIAV